MNRRQIGYLIGVVILLAWVSVTLADTVPEEAQRYMARGMAAVEMAETSKDYERAVREFEQAAKLAPNWPDVYFNLGAVQAKAGNYGEAMRHYKRYLELAPNAPDATKVREEIYKLEYRAEEEVRVRNRFIAYSNGTVLDTRTELMWAAKDNGKNINWANAKAYCENYRGGGYSDWRMPTLDELGGLYDAGKSYKSYCGSDISYDVHITELIHLTCFLVWTSETSGSDAEAVGFNRGVHQLRHQLEPLPHRVLPVRSSKLEDNNPLPGSASVPDNATGGYLGTTLQEMTEELAKAFGLNKVKGAFVLSVNKNSPAEQAGLKSGDIILSFDGKEINEVSALPPIVAATPVGKTVDAHIYRDGKEQTVKVKIGNRQSIVLDSEKASVPSLPTGAQSGDISGTVTDADGNVYQTVKIGNQVWTVENLRTTKYNDGTPIPLVTDKAAWAALTTPGYCYYNNTTNADNIKKFGALYNWYAVDTKKLAPKGWHVPTEAEWDTLQNYLIANGYNWDGTTTDNKIAKSMAAKTDWETYTAAGTMGNDLTTNNKSGFSALPGGSRGSDGGFYNIGFIDYWWSTTEFNPFRGYFRYLSSKSVSLHGVNLSKRMPGALKSVGSSVRLLRD